MPLEIRISERFVKEVVAQRSLPGDPGGVQRLLQGHGRRARTAIRLQRDLDINLAGAALVLELLDEIDTLRSRLHVLDREYAQSNREK